MSPAAAVLLLAAIGIAIWFIGVRRRPWKTCRACGGKGRLAGFLVGTHADCGRCGAKGRVRRIGAGRESLWDRVRASRCPS